MPKEINIEQLKKIQLEILLKVKEFCDEHDLQYFLYYGSLLGAVRHKGYIPWDEDIDIGMPRPDYDLFVKSFNNNYMNLEVMAPELCLNYYAPYANVYDNRTILQESAISHKGIDLGVKIDVFPIDGVADDFEKYTRSKKKLMRYRRILQSRYYNLPALFSVNKRFFCKLLLIRIFTFYFRMSDIQKIIAKESKKIKYSTATHVDQMTFVDDYGYTRLPKIIFDNLINVEFEGSSFKAPSDYDTVLKTIYGDYMQLPPKEQRVPHHGFTAYWKD